MSLVLKSGFTFDYDNLYGEGKVTDADLAGYADALKKAHEAMKVMRATGFIRAHLSKDGEPEKVLFSQTPYIAEGHINSPSSIARLKELGKHAQEHTDVLISLGIGGSFLGNKVLFDVHCGELWNSLSNEQRGNYPRIYFSGNNIDPRRTGDIINHLKDVAQIKKKNGAGALRIMLLVISKSGGTLDTMSNFMVMYD